MARLDIFVAVAALVGLAGTAPADDAAPAPAPAPEPGTTLDARRDGDAAIGRSMFGPTALTAPRSAVVLAVRSPLYPAAFATVSAGITDWLEVGVGGGAWLLMENESGESTTMLSGHAKAQLWRDEHAAIALTGNVYRRPGYAELDPFGSDPPRDVPARQYGAVGAVVTACDATCGVVVSGHVHAVLELADDHDVGFFGGGSLLIGRGRTRVLFDATAMVDGQEHMLLGFAGGRLATPTVSFDLGLAVVHDEHETFPWPVFGLSGRL